MSLKILRWPQLFVLLLVAPPLAWATPIASEDAAAALADPLEVSPRVDVAVTERTSVPVATVDAIASLSDATTPVTHVTSLVPACDTFDGSRVAPSCAFISWFSDEGVRAPDVTADGPIDRPDSDAIATGDSSNGGFPGEPLALGALGIGLVAGAVAVRWRARKRHHRRRTAVRGPKVFARAD